MKSIRYLYKTGYGPSGSHTMGPALACERFRAEHPTADRFRVILYGSLAKTGSDHGTDAVIRKCLSPLPVEIVFDTETVDIAHPNTMDIPAYIGDTLDGKTRVYNVGSGSIAYADGHQDM